MSRQRHFQSAVYIREGCSSANGCFFLSFVFDSDVEFLAVSFYQHTEFYYVSDILKELFNGFSCILSSLKHFLYLCVIEEGAVNFKPVFVFVLLYLYGLAIYDNGKVQGRDKDYSFVVKREIHIGPFHYSEGGSRRECCSKSFVGCILELSFEFV